MSEINTLCLKNCALRLIAPPIIRSFLIPSNLLLLLGLWQHNAWANNLLPCTSGSLCEETPALIAKLNIGDEAANAATRLGELGDPRSIAPLFQCGVYNPVVENKRAAIATLKVLAQHDTLRQIIESHRQNNSDPAIRKLAQVILGLSPNSDANSIQTGNTTANKPTSNIDPDPNRLVFSTTAFIRKAKQWSWNFHNIALWDISYGINSHVEVAMQTAPPIGFVAAMPRIKLGMPLSDNVAIAVKATGGILFPYLVEDGVSLTVLGGGPIMTIGSPKALINFGLPAYYVSNNVQPGDGGGTVIIPTIGGGIQISKRLKLNAEVHVPFILGETDLPPRAWIALYGLRIFDKRIYGDVSFILPIFEGVGSFYKYFPIGFPLISFGFNW